jgi:hypothetical protein
MLDPRLVKREMLVGVVDRRVSELDIDFASARKIAERIAGEALANPLLLAWFDRKTWKHSPAIC